MSLPHAHMQCDHLLTDTCTIAAYSSESADANHERTESFGTATAYACLTASPSYRWRTGWPDVRLTQSIEAWLPHNCPVAVKDKLTHNGSTYRVIDVGDWRGAGRIALCERIQGVT